MMQNNETACFIDPISWQSKAPTESMKPNCLVFCLLPFAFANECSGLFCGKLPFSMATAFHCFHVLCNSSSNAVTTAKNGIFLSDYQMMSMQCFTCDIYVIRIGSVNKTGQTPTVCDAKNIHCDVKNIHTGPVFWIFVEGSESQR